MSDYPASQSQRPDTSVPPPPIAFPYPRFQGNSPPRLAGMIGRLLPAMSPTMSNDSVITTIFPKMTPPMATTTTAYTSQPTFTIPTLCSPVATTRGFPASYRSKPWFSLPPTSLVRGTPGAPPSNIPPPIVILPSSPVLPAPPVCSSPHVLPSPPHQLQYNRRSLFLL